MTLHTYLAHKRGRVTTLAHELGVCISLVSMWANGIRRIPAEQCYPIRDHTGVPLFQLRPDLFPRR